MHPFYSTVAERAHHRCEYCQAPELVFNFPFEVEHIVPLSRNGTNDLENLALACRSCNLDKGNRVSGKLQDSHDVFRFFHPKIDKHLAKINYIIIAVGFQNSFHIFDQR
ncbi:HNH endonuclease [Acaryochloris sp. CCMEE 5410]|uniref:HNH endonuclease n=1 Tax=Acaryochloris sp. CCMEE 5410 TaxID=310037 RepID=UPI0008FF7B3A|nr:HNH endonuclease [Acaryochloris sp. CCMEE 5410]